MPAKNSGFALIPEQIVEESGLLEYQLVDAAIVPELPVAESGEWFRHQMRRILRNLGMLPPARMGRNLAETKEVAMRLKTVDGESITVAIPEAMLDDPVNDLWDWIVKRAKAAT